VFDFASSFQNKMSIFDEVVIEINVSVKAPLFTSKAFTRSQTQFEHFEQIMELVQHINSFIRIPILGAPGVGKKMWVDCALSELAKGNDCPSTGSIRRQAKQISVRGPTNRCTVEFIQNVPQWVAFERYVFIFDLNDRLSLTNHIDNLTASLHGGNIDKLGAVLLVGNKRDLLPSEESATVAETRRIAKRLAEEGGFFFIETSAKTGEGMAEALYLLLNKECRVPFGNENTQIPLPL
jgi:translation initiation factor RLI1